MQCILILMKTTTNKVTGLAVVMMDMATNAAGREVHVAWPKEKAAVSKLEKMGLVKVRRTAVKCGGMTEWWFSA